MSLSIREDIWVKATKPFVEVYILRAYANNEAKIFHYVKYSFFFFFFFFFFSDIKNLEKMVRALLVLVILSYYKLVFF
jgi:hypothetical protein